MVAGPGLLRRLVILGLLLLALLAVTSRASQTASKLTETEDTAEAPAAPPTTAEEEKEEEEEEGQIVQVAGTQPDAITFNGISLSLVLGAPVGGGGGSAPQTQENRYPSRAWASRLGWDPDAESEQILLALDPELVGLRLPEQIRGSHSHPESEGDVSSRLQEALWTPGLEHRTTDDSWPFGFDQDRFRALTGLEELPAAMLPFDEPKPQSLEPGLRRIVMTGDHLRRYECLVPLESSEDAAALLQQPETTTITVKDGVLSVSSGLSQSALAAAAKALSPTSLLLPPSILVEVDLEDDAVLAAEGLWTPEELDSPPPQEKGEESLVGPRRRQPSPEEILAAALPSPEQQEAYRPDEVLRHREIARYVLESGITSVRLPGSRGRTQRQVDRRLREHFAGRCLETKFDQYTLRVCPFDKISRIEEDSSSRHATSLGRFDEADSVKVLTDRWKHSFGSEWLKWQQREDITDEDDIVEEVEAMDPELWSADKFRGAYSFRGGDHGMRAEVMFECDLDHLQNVEWGHVQRWQDLQWSRQWKQREAAGYPRSRSPVPEMPSPAEAQQLEFEHLNFISQVTTPEPNLFQFRVQSPAACLEPLERELVDELCETFLIRLMEIRMSHHQEDPLPEFERQHEQFLQRQTKRRIRWGTLSPAAEVMKTAKASAAAKHKAPSAPPPPAATAAGAAIDRRTETVLPGKVLLPQPLRRDRQGLPLLSDLLLPLRNQCAFLNMGWWSYRLCLLEGFHQFHVGQKEVEVEVMVLDPKTGVTDKKTQRASQLLVEATFGLGIMAPENRQPEQLDSLAIVVDTDSASRTALPYLSQTYTGGDVCDIADRQPRQAEVRMYCDTELSRIAAAPGFPQTRPVAALTYGMPEILVSEHVTIHSVTEVSTCRYLVRVGVSSLCSHPRLAPKPQRARAVVCRPLFDLELDLLPAEFLDPEHAELEAHARVQEEADLLPPKHSKALETLVGDAGDLEHLLEEALAAGKSLALRLEAAEDGDRLHLVRVEAEEPEDEEL